MVILDRLKKADIQYEVLEKFIGEYMLVMNVEENLTAQGHDNLLIAFLKLQQDCGVQVDLSEKLAGKGITLDGAHEPALRFGIDEGAVAPGEQTARTYAAYETVTFSRFADMMQEIDKAISDPALKEEFRTTLQGMGFVIGDKITALITPLPPPPAPPAP